MWSTTARRGAPSQQLGCPHHLPYPHPWPAHLLFAFFINVIYLIPAGEQKNCGCRGVCSPGWGSRRMVGEGK